MAAKKKTPSRANPEIRPADIAGTNNLSYKVAEILAPFVGQDGLVIVMSVGSAHWAAVNGVDSIFAYGAAAYGIAAYYFLAWLRIRK